MKKILLTFMICYSFQSLSSDTTQSSPYTITQLHDGRYQLSMETRFYCITAIAKQEFTPAKIKEIITRGEQGCAYANSDVTVSVKGKTIVVGNES
ncbi:MAG: hypothetical protein Q8Q60_01080 [Candidatus Chromulinivorax sp.]|nr:hypothetical protein [Candidatus Chromulinivorax sp.]